MNELLFQTPWWLPTAFILLGLGVFWTSNNRRQKGGMWGGLAIALIGIAIATTSYLVDTDQEKAVARVKHIVTAVNQKDWTTFRTLIDAQTNVYGLRGPDQITNVVQHASERFNFGNNSITGTTVKQTDTLIEIDIRLFSQGAMNGVSDWQFNFQDFGRGFELRQIQALASQDQDPQRIASAVNSLK